MFPVLIFLLVIFHCDVNVFREMIWYCYEKSFIIKYSWYACFSLEILHYILYLTTFNTFSRTFIIGILMNAHLVLDKSLPELRRVLGMHRYVSLFRYIKWSLDVVFFSLDYLDIIYTLIKDFLFECWKIREL